MTNSTLSGRVSEELKSQLERLSQATQRPKSYLTVKALTEHVDWNAWKTKQIQEAIQEADKGVFVSSQAVDNWLDSWGALKELKAPEANISVK